MVSACRAYTRRIPSPAPATEECPIVPHRVAVRLGAAVVVAALSGCGSTPAADPHPLLQQAKRTIDATPSLHFVLTSSGASGSGTLITGGEGDALRPDSFAGSLRVLRSGFALTVKILSTGGQFMVELPFVAHYEKANPSDYGFGDPALLLDPDKGLSSLLVDTLSAQTADRDRYNGEELDEVVVSLPGDRVAALLTSADKSKPVNGRIGIAVDSHQVRRVVLTGPFFDASKDSTFTVVLDRYGENVTITPPA